MWKLAKPTVAERVAVVARAIADFAETFTVSFADGARRQVLNNRNVAPKGELRALRAVCRQKGCDIAWSICKRCGEDDLQLHYLPAGYSEHGPIPSLWRPQYRPPGGNGWRPAGWFGEEEMPGNRPKQHKVEREEQLGRRSSRSLKHTEHQATAKSPHGWIISNQTSVTCERCGEVETWKCFVFPETFALRAAFFKTHSLCKPMRSERDIDIG